MLTRYDIVSDTHGYLSPELLAELAGADVIVHAGDICSPSDYLTLCGIARVQMCLGNNDWSHDYGPAVKGRKIFYGSGLKWQVTHYRQHLNLTMCDVAICGHTHTPFVERDEWTHTLVMNPGSPTYPRRSRPSMGRILVDDGKVVEAKIITLA
ncbi:YfcE family phosphodiesterase [Olsenella sp. An188]|uniref:YfcE family phosphodiesterase n=1 Tax=Olsenella sp. An188 TaxID=1965579 RepID=UPI000B383E7C|nr:YfcE family phosphodiesterase [Olsenella sp. An188]OUP38032.1 YfcE family phosphodiesterase [Olsenella sp. An188]